LERAANCYPILDYLCHSGPDRAVDVEIEVET
jgi:hypothetical protein